MYFYKQCVSLQTFHLELIALVKGTFSSGRLLEIVSSEKNLRPVQAKTRNSVHFSSFVPFTEHSSKIQQLLKSTSLKSLHNVLYGWTDRRTLYKTIHSKENVTFHAMLLYHKFIYIKLYIFLLINMKNICCMYCIYMCKST